MTQDELVRYIQSLPGVETQMKDDDAFFFVGPDRHMPFATLVTGDRHDTASALHRDGVFRLNLGVSNETYRRHFGDPPPFSKDNTPADTGHDYTALDTLLPHPIYAAMNWVCVLVPGDETFADVIRPLLDEAHAIAAGKRKPA